MEIFGCLAVMVIVKAHLVNQSNCNVAITFVLGYLNDVWKYENDILTKILPAESNNNDDELSILESFTIKIHASNSIHVLGKVKGRNIKLESIDVVIDGIVEALN
jgi:hypothetical protein